MFDRVGTVLHSLTDPATEAAELEEMGFDLACAGEHVSFNVPVGNSIVSLAVAAGATTTIELMSSVVLAPLYPPALLAKLGAALHVASNGRYHLGVGIGGEIPAEFDACGVPRRERGARTNEALEIIRLLWSTDDAHFEGRFDSFRHVTIAPRRTSPPPIWVSGRSEPAMRRAARFGDGWLPYMFTPDQYASSVATIASLREREDALRHGLFIWGAVHEDGDLARSLAVDHLSQTYAQDFSGLVDRYTFVGTPDDVVHRFGEFAEAGVDTLTVGFACPPNHVERMRGLFVDAVLPRLR